MNSWIESLVRFMAGMETGWALLGTVTVVASVIVAVGYGAVLGAMLLARTMLATFMAKRDPMSQIALDLNHDGKLEHVLDNNGDGTHE